MSSDGQARAYPDERMLLAGIASAVSLAGVGSAVWAAWHAFGRARRLKSEAESLRAAAHGRPVPDHVTV
ncbi:hypothetical protein ACGH7X_39980 [Streptomyces sp. BBFR51]|uniref:hypothetical protein n=1 Tax=Streptomyces sp. BBFR51 TaxID=3372856 RepID=UPI0037DC1ACA